MWFSFISVFTCASAWIGDYDVAQTLDFLSAVGEVVTAISANVPVPGLEDPAGVNGKLFARFWQGLLQCSWPENPNGKDLVLIHTSLAVEGHFNTAGVRYADRAGVAIFFAPWVCILAGAAKADWLRVALRFLGDIRAAVRARAPDGVALDGDAPGGGGAGGAAPGGAATGQVPTSDDFDFFAGDGRPAPGAFGGVTPGQLRGDRALGAAADEALRGHLGVPAPHHPEATGDCTCLCDRPCLVELCRALVIVHPLLDRPCAGRLRN